MGGAAQTACQAMGPHTYRSYLLKKLIVIRKAQAVAQLAENPLEELHLMLYVAMYVCIGRVEYTITKNIVSWIGVGRDGFCSFVLSNVLTQMLKRAVNLQAYSAVAETVSEHTKCFCRHSRRSTLLRGTGPDHIPDPESKKQQCL